MGKFTNTRTRMGMVAAACAGFFSQMMAIGNTGQHYQQLNVRMPGQKKGRGRRAGRVVRMRNEGEAHLYGNKLARKAHRHACTIKCARL